jgi:hypothetical protein
MITKIFQKKVVLVPGAKNSYGGYSTKFAGSTKNPKKLIETQKVWTGFDGIPTGYRRDKKN